MANAIARLASRGLEFLEERMQNAVAGKVVFTFPSPASGADESWDFPCVPSVLERGTQIAVGANLVTIALVLYVRRNLFHVADSLWHDAGAEESDENDAPLPRSGQLLRYKGVDYLVLLVGDSGEQSHLKITLGDKDSGL